MNIFDEEDLKKLFARENPKTPEQMNRSAIRSEKVLKSDSRFVNLIKFFSLFLGIFLISYLIINASALYKQSNYFYDSLFNKTYSKVIPTPTPDPFNPVAQAELVIPKIGVDAPIAWNVPEEQYKEKLLEGVIHSAGTALPGEPGNIFITGHSSYYSWVSSDYKSVFALLEKLNTGDKIYIKYSDKVFTYEVTGSVVVKPDDLSVIQQGSDYKLSLMTCVPIGTNLNRLVVSAKQISQ